MDGQYPDGTNLNLNARTQAAFNQFLHTTHRQNFLVPSRSLSDLGTSSRSRLRLRTATSPEGFGCSSSERSSGQRLYGMTG